MNYFQLGKLVLTKKQNVQKQTDKVETEKFWRKKMFPGENNSIWPIECDQKP